MLQRDQASPASDRTRLSQRARNSIQSKLLKVLRQIVVCSLGRSQISALQRPLKLVEILRGLRATYVMLMMWATGLQFLHQVRVQLLRVFQVSRFQIAAELLKRLRHRGVRRGILRGVSG